MLMLLNRKHWHEPVTETPKLNTTEIWEFVNLTEDTHPMHLHLVRFQILDRRIFDTIDYQHRPKSSASPAPPSHPNPTNSAGRIPSSAPPAPSPASSSASKASPANTSTTATSSSTKPTT